MRDIDTAVVDSLKVLDPKWPIREAYLRPTSRKRRDLDPSRTLDRYLLVFNKPSGLPICSLPAEGLLACFLGLVA